MILKRKGKKKESQKVESFSFTNNQEKEVSLYLRKKDKLAVGSRDAKNGQYL